MNKKIHTLSKLWIRKIKDRRIIFSVTRAGEVLVFDDKWLEELK